MQFPKVFNLATSTLRRYGNNSKACKNFGQSDFVAELVCTEIEQGSLLRGFVNWSAVIRGVERSSGL